MKTSAKPQAIEFASAVVPTIKRRTIVAVIESINSNPNGDPNNEGRPRIGPDGRGEISPQSVKRKIRDYVKTVHGKEIFIDHGVVLNVAIENAYLSAAPSDKPNKDTKKHVSKGGFDAMCARYWDVRVFGGVMTTGEFNCGKALGPAQVSWGESIGKIMPQELKISRVAATSESQSKDKGNQTFGASYKVPGCKLYTITITICPYQAAKTGMTEDDVTLLIEAIQNCWTISASASRPNVSCPVMVVFEHKRHLGNARTSTLEGLVQLTPPTSGPARSYDDYTLTISDPPSGVTAQLVTL